MSKKYEGKDLNDQLIKHIRDFIVANKAKGKTPEEMENDPQYYKTDYVDENGEPIFVWSDSPNTIPELAHYAEEFDQMLNFGSNKVDDTEIYDIPGFKVKDLTDPNKKIETNIRIRKEDAKKLVANSAKYKDIFGVELPQEVYQIAKDNILPGFGYKAPEPKKMSETDEEYEARMESHYKANGLEKEALENYREPYPHEKVDYSLPTPMMTKQGRASYQAQAKNKVLDPKVAGHGGKGMAEGEKKRVVDTDPTLGQRIYNLYQTGKSALKPKAIKNILLTVGGIGLGGALIAAAPAGVAMLAVPTAAFTAIGLVYLKYGKPKLKQLKEKVINWFKGEPIKKGTEEETEVTTTQEKGKGKSQDTEPEKKTTPEKGTGPGSNPSTNPKTTPGTTPSGGNNGGGAAGTDNKPDETQIEIPAELEHILRALEPENQTLKMIQTRKGFAEQNKTTLEEKLKNPNLTEEERKNINDELTAEIQKIETYIQQEREIYVGIYKMLQQFIYNKTEEKGGPRI